MKGKNPPPEVKIRVHGRRGDGRVAAGAGDQALGEVKPFKPWVPWLVPSFVAANVVMFAVTMYVNDCPKKSGYCIARFLGRFAFQTFKENPLLGPSSDT